MIACASQSRATWSEVKAFQETVNVISRSICDQLHVPGCQLTVRGSSTTFEAVLSRSAISSAPSPSHTAALSERA
jgi:hypothetical protein